MRGRTRVLQPKLIESTHKLYELVLDLGLVTMAYRAEAVPFSGVQIPAATSEHQFDSRAPCKILGDARDSGIWARYVRFHGRTNWEIVRSLFLIHIYSLLIFFRCRIFFQDLLP